MKAEKKAQQRDLIVKFLYAMDLTYEYLIEIKYYLHKPNLVEEIHRTKQLHAREATSCFLQLDILCMGELRRALVELYSAHISYTQKAYDWLQKADPNAEWPVLDAVTKARLRFLDIVRSELA
ncbi:hypothetical protein [Chitinimonas sp.]|uniref:hypothetical protein n=1 Tax=Chitinimonas sp. TaxID=1934313 RepID=UPI0035B13483